MKPIPLDDCYFEKFSTKQVTLKPVDPRTKEAALALMAILDGQVAAWGIRSVLHGSTALEIEGKGEIEVVLYLDDENWEPVKSHLVEIYGRLADPPQPGTGADRGDTCPQRRTQYAHRYPYRNAGFRNMYAVCWHTGAEKRNRRVRTKHFVR